MAAAFAILVLPVSIELVQEWRAAAIATTYERPHAFICHADGDHDAALDLREELRAAGIRPWLAKVDLPVGQDWKLEIDKAVSAADAVLVLLSRNATSKVSYFHKEIRMALDATARQPGNRPVVMPLRLEPCSVPGRLKHLQYLDLFEIDGTTRTIEAIRKIATTAPDSSERRIPVRVQRIGRALAAIVTLIALPALGASASNHRQASSSPSSTTWAQSPTAIGIDPDEYTLLLKLGIDEIDVINTAIENQFISTLNAQLRDSRLANRRVATVETFVCSKGRSGQKQAVVTAQRLNQILHTRSSAFSHAKSRSYASLGCSIGSVQMRILFFTA
jgi:hypothetical protein